MKSKRHIPTDWAEVREAFSTSITVRGLSKTTLDCRLDAVDCFFGWLLDTTEIDYLLAVAPQTLEAFKLWMQCERDWAVATVETRLSGLKAFFSFLEARDLLLFNPCEDLHVPRDRNTQARKILTHDEVRSLLAAPDLNTAKGLRDRAILEVFYSTGIRRAELLALKVQDVDCRGGLVQVRLGKGRKDRIVPLGIGAADILDRYIHEVRVEWLRGKATTAFMWLSSIVPHERPLTMNALDKLVQGYGKRVGISVSCHVWRHTCATHMLQGGADITHVQQLLGHADTTATELYLRVSEQELSNALRQTHPNQQRCNASQGWMPAAGAKFKGSYQSQA